MIIEKTFYANIYCGFRAGYTDVYANIVDARKIVEEYLNKEIFGTTMTPTWFHYPGGREPGVIVGLIQYPRFHKDEQLIRYQALMTAHKLRKGLQQERVTVVFSDYTAMITEDDTEESIHLNIYGKTL
ncbi:MAG: hypothetical protein WC979_00435 [Candidatus Pacearchaeota archaeon]|jgi:hypothetical protein|nr:hypothetical protein [Clostridia bacterium]